MKELLPMANFTWLNPATTKDWSDPAQWDLGTVPSTADQATVSGAQATITSTAVGFGTVTFTTPATTTLQWQPDNSGTLADLEGTFNLTSGTIALGPDVFNAGFGRNDTFNVTGGGMLVDSAIVTVDQSALDSASTGQTVQFAPNLTIGRGGLFQALNGTAVVFNSATTINPQGTLTASGNNNGSPAYNIISGSLTNYGSFSLTNGATADIKASLTNASSGVISIDGGSALTIDTFASVNDTGTITLSNGGMLKVTTFAPAGSVINFADGNANTVTVTSGNQALDISSRVTNFQDGDVIDFTGYAFAAGDSLSQNGNILQVSNGLHIIGKLTFANLANIYSTFSLVDDGNGNFANGTGGIALVSNGLACYGTGTLIRTAAGTKPVQDLQPGDPVWTRSGGQAVLAIGHRRVDTTRMRHPAMAWPVRVRADAFGDGMPSSDLIVSPEHMLWIDGALVPARLLIDGVNVVQEIVAAIDYWHVVLAEHDVLLANGMTAESWLDTGNRTMFDAPPAAAIAPTVACGPIVDHGPALDRIRAHLPSNRLPSIRLAA